MGDGELKCYLAILLLADRKTGSLEMSAEELGERIGKDARTVRRYLKDLERHYIAVERPYKCAPIISVKKHKTAQDSRNVPARPVRYNTAVLEEVENDPAHIDGMVARAKKLLGMAVDKSVDNGNPDGQI